MGETPELLNVLASATYHVGDRERCIALLRKSLEMKSDQGDIRALLERLDRGMLENMDESPSRP